MADNPLSDVFAQRPITGLHFRVSLADMAGAASMATGGVGGTKFSKVSGLKVYAFTKQEEGEAVAKSEGVETFIDDIRYDNIRLERGLTSEPTPFTLWCMQVFQEFAQSKDSKAKPEPTGSFGANMTSGKGLFSIVKNLVITLMNEKGIPLMAWAVRDAVPLSWEVSDFNAMQTNYVTETIILRHKGFEIVPIPGAGML